MNKWEGGVVGPDGACYCMPNNHRRVLRISPPGVNVLPSTTDNIKADVASLRSSSHILGYSKARKVDEGPSGADLPINLKKMQTIPFDAAQSMAEAIKAMLSSSDITEGAIISRLENITLNDSALLKSDKGR